MANYANGQTTIGDASENEVPVKLLAKLVFWFKRNTGVVAWILSFQAIGVVIGLTSNSDSEWFESLEKSPLQPPPALFGIAWAFLYFLIAIVGYQIANAESGSAKYGLFPLFAFQQLLNWSWNAVFFNLEEIEVSLIIISVIGTCVAILIFELAKIGAWEGYLLIPYLLWSLFATHLNTYMARNNC